MMFKKVLALAMSLCMVFAMSATAFAATLPSSGTVAVYKDGTTYGNTSNLSMADAAFSNYTTETDEDGEIVVSMPLTPIYRMGLYGYIKNTTTATVNGTPVTVQVTGTDSTGYYTTNPTLHLTIPASVVAAASSPVKVDIHFDILLSSSNHWIESNMDTNADLYLETSAS